MDDSETDSSKDIGAVVTKLIRDLEGKGIDVKELLDERVTDVKKFLKKKGIKLKTDDEKKAVELMIMVVNNPEVLEQLNSHYQKYKGFYGALSGLITGAASVYGSRVMSRKRRTKKVAGVRSSSVQRKRKRKRKRRQSQKKQSRKSKRKKKKTGHRSKKKIKTKK